MRALWILRHAKSSWDDDDLPDHDRPLAPRGERAAAAVGAYLDRADEPPELVLCSTARRARETWERAAHQLRSPPAVRMLPALYDGDTDALVGALRAIPDEIRSALLVGHLPGVQELAQALAPAGDRDAVRRLGQKFPTAGLALLRIPDGGWRQLSSGAARLAAFRVPKDLL